MKLADNKLDSLLVYHDWLIDNDREDEAKELLEVKLNDFCFTEPYDRVGVHPTLNYVGKPTLWWNNVGVLPLYSCVGTPRTRIDVNSVGGLGGVGG